MRRSGARSILCGALGLSIALLAAVPPLAARVIGPTKWADFGGERVSADARRLADWAVSSDDTHGQPFLIVDKIEARVFAFDPYGRLRGSAPALLGLAKGDTSPPGIGTRRLADISRAERITPAGRFVAAMGHNLSGKDILWVDYATAISLHRVISTNTKERRLQRLATPSADDNRISYGCINVPVAFYENTVRPLFALTEGIVYVMPEAGPLGLFFPSAARAASLDQRQK